MNATELSWYYILYLFASLMVVLGVINLWMFRKQVWKPCLPKLPAKTMTRERRMMSSFS